MTFNKEKFEFKVEPEALTTRNKGEYKISALLKDENGGKANYPISLKVICYDFDTKNATNWKPPAKTTNPPLPFIKKITGTGKVYVKFSEPMETVNATNITNGTLIIEEV
jgi:hypothetical protein